jgi:hypothetical protein
VLGGRVIPGVPGVAPGLACHSSRGSLSRRAFGTPKDELLDPREGNPQPRHERWSPIPPATFGRSAGNDTISLASHGLDGRLLEERHDARDHGDNETEIQHQSQDSKKSREGHDHAVAFDQG